MTAMTKLTLRTAEIALKVEHEPGYPLVAQPIPHEVIPMRKKRSLTSFTNGPPLSP